MAPSGRGRFLFLSEQNINTNFGTFSETQRSYVKAAKETEGLWRKCVFLLGFTFYYVHYRTCPWVGGKRGVGGDFPCRIYSEKCFLLYNQSDLYKQYRQVFCHCFWDLSIQLGGSLEVNILVRARLFETAAQKTKMWKFRWAFRYLQEAGFLTSHFTDNSELMRKRTFTYARTTTTCRHIPESHSLDKQVNYPCSHLKATLPKALIPTPLCYPPAFLPLNYKFFLLSSTHKHAVSSLS